jgi:hypothetical protein
MARHAYLSPSHFSRLFKEQTSYAPIDYFIHLKVQDACRLLFLTSLTLDEISYKLGYEDPAYSSHRDGDCRLQTGSADEIGYQSSRQNQQLDESLNCTGQIQRLGRI